MSATEFTIFHRIAITAVDHTGAPIGTFLDEAVYHIPARSGVRAIEELITYLAEDSPAVCDFDIYAEDDSESVDGAGASEREMVVQMAMDDITGEFAAFAGRHDTRPAMTPDYEEGDLLEIDHRERRPRLAA